MIAMGKPLLVYFLLLAPFTVFVSAKRNKNVEMIIDTDPGVDDAGALILALSNAAKQKAKIHAITLVAGNNEMDQHLINCYRILKLMNATKIPVYMGARSSILGLKFRDDYFGKDGLGDRPDLEPTITREEAEKLAKKENAVNGIIRLVKRRPGRITLVALGPLTNIALALRMEPNLKYLLRKLVILGGSKFAQGNSHNVAAEFNFYKDPEAAFAVVQELKPTIVPWETVRDQASDWSWYDKFVGCPSKVAQFEKAIHELAYVKNRDPTRGFILADQVAVAVALKPEVVTDAAYRKATVELNGKVTRGALIVDWRPVEEAKKNVNIELVMSFDRNGTQKLMMESVGCD